MLTIEWCIWIATGAFVILVAALIVTMRMLVVRINTLTAAATDMKQDISHISLECSSLIQTTDETLRVISSSMQAAQGIVQATRQVSASIEQTAHMIEEVTSTLSSRVQETVRQEKVGQQIEEAMQWAELAMSAWQIWQGGRKKYTKQQTTVSPDMQK